jgi:thymidylate synthase (FAD)
VGSSDVWPVIAHQDIHNAERMPEFGARYDYGEKNAKKLGELSKMRVENPHWDELDIRDAANQYVETEVPILKKYMMMKHESMIELSTATFYLEGSRVFTHEMVRHRPASYQQESQRFVKYEGQNPVDVFFLPPELDEADSEQMLAEFKRQLEFYERMREKGVAPQIARYILPNAMSTRLIMQTNAREWRHILKLRTDKSAQPEMREIALMIHTQLSDIWPNVMSDVLEGERSVR